MNNLFRWFTAKQRKQSLLAFDTAINIIQGMKTQAWAMDVIKQIHPDTHQILVDQHKEFDAICAKLKQQRSIWN